MCLCIYHLSTYLPTCLCVYLSIISLHLNFPEWRSRIWSESQVASHPHPRCMFIIFLYYFQEIHQWLILYPSLNIIIYKYVGSINGVTKKALDRYGSWLWDPERMWRGNDAGISTPVVMLGHREGAGMRGSSEFPVEYLLLRSLGTVTGMCPPAFLWQPVLPICWLTVII